MQNSWEVHFSWEVHHSALMFMKELKCVVPTAMKKEKRKAQEAIVPAWCAQAHQK